MLVIEARNVHEALPMGLDLLRREGYRRDSRNGPVLMINGPVATVYHNPLERVVFHSWRDANPFFHFYESLWMLAGRNNVKPLTRYVKRMAEFSDDGEIFNAAYGNRWREARGPVGLVTDGVEVEPYQHRVDQLVIIAEELRRNPETRQCVLQIWDHRYDLGTQTKDHACNVAATFQTDKDGHLDMTMFCRSNDIIWGAYGANAVHMSYLLEYVATRARLQVGKYTQISVNYHAYMNVFEPMVEHWSDGEPDPYEYTPVYPASLGTCDDQWDEECRRFTTLDGTAPEMMKSTDNPFWFEVAYPIVRAHDAYKSGDMSGAKHHLEQCDASDWKLACQEWLDRRQAKKLKSAE